MDLVALQAFVKIVQTGSFTRAAEALKSEKAHLSRVLGRLERELGVRLLERSTRALSLTEIGREFFERAIGILASVEEARSAVQRFRGEARGTLRLTCGVEFGMIAVSGWINDYLQRHPLVQVDVEFTGRITDIVHEGFDLAIRVGTLAESTLASRRLGELDYGLFASAAYLGRHPAPAEPADLAGLDLLAFAGSGHGTGLSFNRDGERQQVEVAARLRANNVFALRDAAIAGLGVAPLPLLVVDAPLRDGRLIQLLDRWSLPAVPVHAVFASARYLTPKVRSFIDLAVDAMKSSSR